MRLEAAVLLSEAGKYTLTISAVFDSVCASEHECSIMCTHSHAYK